MCLRYPFVSILAAASNVATSPRHAPRSEGELGQGGDEEQGKLLRMSPHALGLLRPAAIIY